MKILASGLIAALLCLFKYPHRVFHGFLWAEDGAVFVKQAMEEGARALFIPYAGYQHLVPRLISGAWSAIASPERFPHGFAWTCIVMYAAVAAALFALSRRHFPSGIRGDLYALTAALLPFLVPQSAEIYFTITNLQWFLAPVLGFIVIDLSTGRDSRARRVAGFLLGLTGPFGVMLLPVALVVWLSSKARRIAALLPYLVACAVQLATYLWSPPGQPLVPLAGYALTSTFLISAIGEPFEPGHIRLSTVALEILAVVVSVALIWVVGNGGRARKAGFMLLAGALTLWLIGLARQGLPGEVIHWDGYGARYLLLPELCVAYALLLSFAAGNAARVRGGAVVLLVCLVTKSAKPVLPEVETPTVLVSGRTTFMRIAPGWTVTIKHRANVE